MKPRPSSPAARRQLVALLLTTAGLAMVSGLLLILKPDGRLLGLSTEFASSSFASYLVPGVMLAVLVGGAQLFAGLAVARRHPRGLRMGVIAGLILIAWIAILAMMMGSTTWLQPVFFGIAVIELILVAANLPQQRRSKR